MYIIFCFILVFRCLDVNNQFLTEPTKGLIDLGFLIF